MLFHKLGKDNDNNSPEAIIQEGDKKEEDEFYCCTECGSNIEILDLSEDNNIFSFKCPKDGNIKISIKEYFEKKSKNTCLCRKCIFCNKQQYEFKNDIFKYCFNCKIIICNNCIFSHDESHFIIENNKLLIKCLLHPKNDNKSFCMECNIIFARNA